MSSAPMEVTCIYDLKRSKSFIRTIASISILNVMYNRIEMNEDDLDHRQFFDVTYVKCKRPVSDPLLLNYRMWIKGITSAFNSNCLTNIYILMKSQSTNEIIEEYKFSIIYAENSDDKNMPAAELLDRSDNDTVTFLKELISLRETKRLPKDDTIVCLDLQYSNDTPCDFLPSAITSNPVDRSKTIYSTPVIINNCYHKFEFTKAQKLVLNCMVQDPPEPESEPMQTNEQTNDEYFPLEVKELSIMGAEIEPTKGT